MTEDKVSFTSGRILELASTILTPGGIEINRGHIYALVRSFTERANEQGIILLNESNRESLLNTISTTLNLSDRLRIVDNVRTIIQRQNEYIYIPDLKNYANA